MSFDSQTITEIEWRSGGMTAEERRRSGMMETITTMNMDYAALEMRIVASLSDEDMIRAGVEMFGNRMCGDCLGIKLTKSHDPMKDSRRVCPDCRTVWPGAEPWNRRREAVMATRAKRGLS